MPAVTGQRSLVVGSSPVFLRAMWEVFLVASHDAAVLIEGESGTGKELISRAIHDLSSRREGPFVAVNCAALPKDLLESELFGHVRGAFTGADRDRPGLTSEASGGTLFLDEIPSLDLALQAKLLRFLDAGNYRPVGGREERTSDVRVLAATNRGLHEEIDSGRFRDDLYYRLSSLVIRVPPLRKRGGDIRILWEHFVERETSRSKKPAPRLTDEARAALDAYDWPGNVRELRNAALQTTLRFPGQEVKAEDLRLGAGRPDAASNGDSAVGLHSSSEPRSTEPLWKRGPLKELKEKLIEDFERRYLKDLLRDHQGNVTKAAKSAGKHRRALTELLRRYELDADAYRP